jgi:hypothetical protein
VRRSSTGPRAPRSAPPSRTRASRKAIARPGSKHSRSVHSRRPGPLRLPARQHPPAARRPLARLRRHGRRHQRGRQHPHGRRHHHARRSHVRRRRVPATRAARARPRRGATRPAAGARKHRKCVVATRAPTAGCGDRCTRLPSASPPAAPAPGCD